MRRREGWWGAAARGTVRDAAARGVWSAAAREGAGCGGARGGAGCRSANMMDFMSWVKETLRVCESCEDGMMDANVKASG